MVMNVAASAPVAWGWSRQDKQILRRNQTMNQTSSSMPHVPDESMHIASDDEDVQTNDLSLDNDIVRMNAEESETRKLKKAPELSP
jgi:hypothetical protein